ncbi:MAG TPA: CHAT domain-containing tetratricopeptide repeat protein [Thermoanaerobaculia bacterium]|nr:CHAT domain-containing tetratricopeptide repeat protein [Thermoanaerobaculia bacterium]
MHATSSPRAAGLLAALVSAAQLLASSGAAQAQVVVLEAAADRAAQRAGLRAGDLLVGWQREEAATVVDRGSFADPWDVLLVDLAQVPRTGVTLLGERDGAPAEWPLSPDVLGLETRPPLDGDLLARLPGAAGAGEGSWEALAEALEARSRLRAAGWAWFRAGLAAAERAEAAASRAAYARSEEVLQRAGTGHLAALVASDAGFDAMLRAEWQDADLFLERAVAASAALGDAAGSELAAGWARYRRQILLRLQHRYDEALAEGERADAAFARWAPVSARRAAVLNELASSLRQLERLELSEQRQREALALVRPLFGSTGRIAGYLSNLATILLDRGDLAGAEAWFVEALEVARSDRPGSVVEANLYNNLGAVRQLRGDLVGAEDMHRKALALREALVPATPDLATSYENLALVALARGDAATAATMVERAAALYRELLPNTETTAAVLSIEAAVRHLDGDLEGAAAALAESARLWEAIAPASSGRASMLASWASFERQRGDLARAAALLDLAIALQERIAPQGPGWIEATTARAEIDLEDGRHGAARESLERALASAASRQAGPEIEARIRHGLGLALSAAGESAGARRELCAAADLFDTHRPRIGGGDRSRALASQLGAPFYRECARAWLAAGDATAAFDLVERSRGRAFLEQLSRRDLRFVEVAPELARERDLLDRESDRLRAGLRDASIDSERRARTLSRLRQVRTAQRELELRIADRAPALAPRPEAAALGWSDLRPLLPAGTLLLSYVVHLEETWLLTARAEGPAPTVTVLPVGRERLQELVDQLRRSLERPDPSRLGDLERTARRLGELLLQPVAAELARADRVLVLPDGPLHVVPFAALAPGGADARRLIEIAPVSFASSATVWARLAQRRRESADGESRPVIAFGDPAIGERAGERGLPPLPRLASSRLEVETLARLWGPRVRAFVAEEASEANLRSLPSEIAILHLAVHGLIDDRDPLASALVLADPQSPPAAAETNGLLEVWEIFERLRFDADLVALSACGTALGEGFDGEGLLGLTRAFQLAGARAVLASLWEVDDRSTAELMRRFYQALRRGVAPEDALREAQLALLRGDPLPSGAPGATPADAPTRGVGAVVAARPDWRHPFHWAAFQLYGAGGPSR